MLGSPYLGLDRNKVTSIRFEVATKDIELIKKVTGNPHINRYILGNAIYAIAADLRAAGLDHYSPDHTDLVDKLIARRFSSDTSIEGRRLDDASRGGRVCNSGKNPEDVKSKPKGRGSKKQSEKEVGEGATGG